jgi:hypothetical protein
MPATMSWVIRINKSKLNEGAESFQNTSALSCALTPRVQSATIVKSIRVSMVAALNEVHLPWWTRDSHVVDVMGLASKMFTDFLHSESIISINLGPSAESVGE